jgi:hypothetical protein
VQGVDQDVGETAQRPERVLGSLRGFRVIGGARRCVGQRGDVDRGQALRDGVERLSVRVRQRQQLSRSARRERDEVVTGE